MSYNIHGNPRIKDSQNPYRTGVLVGNYTEDRFGRENKDDPVCVSTTPHLIFIEKPCDR